MTAYSPPAWLVLLQLLACMAAEAHSAAPFIQQARIKQSEHSCENSDEELQHCPLRTLPASFLQTRLQINERAGTTEKLGSQQASVATNASNWQDLVSPKDCVSGKSEKDSQACYLASIKALASAYFSGFSPASVSLEDFEDVFNVITRSGIGNSKGCCVVQVINNSVWEVGTCNANNQVFSTLLHHALSISDVGFIPDVEMHICDYDYSALLLPANGVRVPVLVPASVPEGRGYMIPVPMNHRRGKSTKSLKTPDLGGYYDICLGRANFDSTAFGRELAGERQCLPYSATPWPSKKNVAFFRGSLYTDSQPCDECSCQTNSSLCYDCRFPSVCKASAYGGYGLPCARPRARTQCLRADLIEALGSRDGFDVSRTSDYMDECMWEMNKYLLVIGNNIGWADRVQESLFKTSATILVDSGAYEWFYPLMMEDLHFIRADPTVESVTDTVRTAIERDDKDITQRANAFARLIFGIDNVARYTALVAKAYGRLQAYQPQIRAGAIQPCGDGYASMKKSLTSPSSLAATDMRVVKQP